MSKITKSFWVAAVLSSCANAMAAPSSVTLQYGPSFFQQSLPTSITQPAFDFEVSQFWRPDDAALSTVMEIRAIEHQETAAFSLPDGWICACVTQYTPPQISTFTFGLPQSVTAPFGYSDDGYYSQLPFTFDANIASTLFMGDRVVTVQIGEMETQFTNGAETLTRFAADFIVQFGETSFSEFVDPVTGEATFVQAYTEYPGNWFAGSLRYQSDTEAFAFLSPVPEPHSYAQMLVGLALLGLMARRPA